MSAIDVLNEVARHGGRLIPNGDRLRMTAPAPLPDDLVARVRQHKPELMRLLADQAEAAPSVPQGTAETFTNYGKGYRHADGRVEPGGPEPMPPPALPWPPELSLNLRRVSTAYEWSDQDRRDFVTWARRSKEGLADARVFLETEAAKLPQPGLDDRRRTVLAMLEGDPDLRVAWLATDDGQSDPVLLTLAVRGKGSCELAIPRAKFDALALPQLIGELADRGGA